MREANPDTYKKIAQERLGNQLSDSKPKNAAVARTLKKDGRPSQVGKTSAVDETQQKEEGYLFRTVSER